MIIRHQIAVVCVIVLFRCVGYIVSVLVVIIVVVFAYIAVHISAKLCNKAVFSIMNTASKLLLVLFY